MRTIYTALSLAIGLGFGAEAEIIPGSEFRYGNWSGAGYTFETNGQFSHCAMSAGYQSGDILYFSVNRQATVSVAVQSPALQKFDSGLQIPVALYVDRRTPFFATATVLEDGLAGLEIPDFERAMTAFKRGYTLVIEGGGLRGVYDLAGTFRALDLALSCARTFYNHAAVPRGPASGSTDKSMTFQLASMVIADLGIRSFRFLSEQELAAQGWQNAVAWISPENGMSGLSLIMPRGQVDNLRQTDPEDTQFLANECTGDYAVSARALEIEGKSAPGREIRLLCQTVEGMSELYLAKVFSGQEIIYNVLSFYETGATEKENSPSRSELNERAAVVAAGFVRE